MNISWLDSTAGSLISANCNTAALRLLVIIAKVVEKAPSLPPFLAIFLEGRDIACHDAAIMIDVILDFGGCIRRLYTLTPLGRITRIAVDDEIANLQRDWHILPPTPIIA